MWEAVSAAAFPKRRLPSNTHQESWDSDLIREVVRRGGCERKFFLRAGFVPRGGCVEQATVCFLVITFISLSCRAMLSSRLTWTHPHSLVRTSDGSRVRRCTLRHRPHQRCYERVMAWQRPASLCAAAGPPPWPRGAPSSASSAVPSGRR
eukprot:92763-Rhodomonas_salina.3